MGAGKISAIVVLLLSFSILADSVQAKYSAGSSSVKFIDTDLSQEMAS